MTYRSLAEIRAAKLAELREVRAEQERRAARRMASLDVFSLIGYEPICKPRALAQIAVRGGQDVPVPEPCGSCPQERFHAATESDVLYGGAAGGGKVPPSSPRASGRAHGTRASGCCWSAARMTS